ncbi:unnamed protein product [Microthlaspi erraticum]|uniref:Retrotransposon gag domain-containing protein n=1 Tax=Microthlaspi erraticum TaxID=1685480 RepID=A0A6D2JYJ5_9BRAS|nr:unnamed protein product [Microthlaspi erraticum]
MPRDGARHNEEVMGDFDSNPTLLIDRNPIQPPLPEGRSYEISPEIIGLVKQNQFQGKPQENPLEHIDAFEEICGTISAGGAPKEYLKCKLFSFTLTGKALRWVKSLPAQSITTWKEYKVAFLASNGNFMTKTVTEAKILIENLASSDSDNFIGHERAVKAINSDPYRDGYSEIKAMMAEILRNQGREVERQREAYRVESTIIQDYFGDLIPTFKKK